MSPTYVIIWYNGSAVIRSGNQIIGSNKRITADDSSLRIQNVDLTDTGLYSCQIHYGSKKVEVKVQLYVLSEHSSAEIYVKGERKTDDEIVHQRTHHLHLFDGDKVSFECVTLGGSAPWNVIWSKEGKRLDDRQSEGYYVDGPRITVSPIKLHNRGVYQCLATNGKNPNMHRTLTLRVKDKPVFKRHENYTNTAEGKDARLVCSYSAYPPATSHHWFRTEPKEKLSNNHKYVISNEVGDDGHNRTILTIRNVGRKDMISYICEVENKIGSSGHKVTLGLKPNVPHLNNHWYSNGVLYTNWTVESVQRLNELRVLYRLEDGSGNDIAEAPEIDESSQVTDGVWLVQASYELPPGKWLVSAAAQNTEDWSMQSSFESIKVPPDTDMDVIAKAGIGTTGGAGTIALRASLIILLLFPVFLLI